MSCNGGTRRTCDRTNTTFFTETSHDCSCRRRLSIECQGHGTNTFWSAPHFRDAATTMQLVQHAYPSGAMHFLHSETGVRPDQLVGRNGKCNCKHIAAKLCSSHLEDVGVAFAADLIPIPFHRTAIVQVPVLDPPVCSPREQNVL